jgi:hypothetical protein
MDNSLMPDSATFTDLTLGELRAAFGEARSIVPAQEPLWTLFGPADPVIDQIMRWATDGLLRDAVNGDAAHEAMGEVTSGRLRAVLARAASPAPSASEPHDIQRAVDELEAIVHPEGRCAVCGGGKPYWKHTANDTEYHPFAAPSASAAARREE